MPRKKKDFGFTLFEIMIVLAVIALLVEGVAPKAARLKLDAKLTGVDTNVRVVRGYVESKIDRWLATGLTKDTIGKQIISDFSGQNNALVNPITSVSTDHPQKWYLPYVGGRYYTEDINNASMFVWMTDGHGALTDDPNNLKGTVVVSVDDRDMARIRRDMNGDGKYDDQGSIKGVHIFAYDDDGKLMADKTINIPP